MNKPALYKLADATIIEPLIAGWYAWSHLLSPVTASLHFKNYQLPTLASYLKAPDLHAQACRSPQLLGGPFVDISPDQASELKTFYITFESTYREQSEIGMALMDFSRLLNESAVGQSLEPFYKQTPEPLSGCVELVYDYWNRPMVRCMEAMFYRSKYYRESAQALLLHKAETDRRPFFLSTPRLRKTESIEWSVPFRNAEMDELFKLDIHPRSLDEVCELLGEAPAGVELITPLLTQTTGSNILVKQCTVPRLRYFGHATVLLEYDGLSILTDPWVSVVPETTGTTRFTYSDLPETIDYALITHAHADHLVFETLLRLRHRIQCLVVPRSSGLHYADVSLKLLGEHLGFKHIIEVDCFDKIDFANGDITVVPFLGEHGDLPHAKAGYVVRVGSQRILFAADANCLDKAIYEHVRESLGDVQTAFIGMECVGAPMSWFYGSVMPVQPNAKEGRSRRLNGCDADSALQMLKALGCKRVYVYALGREPWLEHIMALSPSDDTPQLSEARKLLAYAPREGWIDAQCLFGSFELELPNAG